MEWRDGAMPVVHCLAYFVVNETKFVHESFEWFGKSMQKISLCDSKVLIYIMIEAL